MVVMYSWRTDKNVIMLGFAKKTTYWKGWFLFGVIPIYIKTVEIVYH